MKQALVLFSSIATHLVFGGSAPEAANDPRALQLTYGAWTKACINSTCFVGTDARGACFPSGGSAAIIVTGDKSASLSVQLGTKRMLEGAISVQVDQGAPILIPHPECDDLGCAGKFEIDGEFIERLKHSQTITLTATTTAHEKLGLSLSLVDFAKAYDGPASDWPKVYQKTISSEKMQEELTRAAEEKKARECKE